MSRSNGTLHIIMYWISAGHIYDEKLVMRPELLSLDMVVVWAQDPELGAPCMSKEWVTK